MLRHTLRDIQGVKHDVTEGDGLWCIRTNALDNSSELVGGGMEILKSYILSLIKLLRGENVLGVLYEVYLLTG